MSELKPCPWCGNKPLILKNAIKSSQSCGTWSICLSYHDPQGECILFGRVGFHSYESESDAIEAWNNRFDTNAQGGE